MDLVESNDKCVQNTQSVIVRVLIVANISRLLITVLIAIPYKRTHTQAHRIIEIVRRKSDVPFFRLVFRC